MTMTITSKDKYGLDGGLDGGFNGGFDGGFGKVVKEEPPMILKNRDAEHQREVDEEIRKGEL